MKRFFAFLLICLVLSAGACAQAELHGYDKAQGGYQYVSLGSYPYEADGTKAPVLWEVLDISDNQALLLSVMILDTQQVIFVKDENAIKNYTYRRITDYAESDLNSWMNDTMLNTLLGGDPMLSALTEGVYGRLYILTDEQLMTPDYGFTKARYGENKARQAVGTPYAIKQRGLYVARENGASTYWAAAVKGPTQYKLQCVGYNGHLSYGAYSRVNIGVRAALTLNLDQCAVCSGAGTKDDPFVFTSKNAPESAENIVAEPKEAQAPVSDAPAAQEPPQAPIESAEILSPEAPSDNDAPSDTPSAEATADKTSESQPTAAVAAALVREPTPNPEAAEETTATKTAGENVLTLSFVGDCSLGDATQARSQPTSLTNTVQKNGYGWLFSNVSKYLLNDDYSFANLEVNFTMKENLKSQKMYNMIAPPDHVEILKAGGIDAVNTVNNHCMDFTDKGYQDTLNTLDAAGVNHFGTVYPGQDKGSDILGRANVKGVSIGMIGFSYPADSDIKRIASRIETLRAEGCQLVVVSLHWGRETHMTCESWQYAYAKKVIDAGADVIWGHHPHVVQPIMFYKGKPIFFSTGNFIFGTMSQVDPSTGVFQLDYTLDAENAPVLKTLRVVPCETADGGDYRPFELTDPDARKACLKKLTSKKKIKGFDNLPEAFLTTGIVHLNTQGEILAE